MKEKHFGPIWFIPGENKGKYPFCHSVYIEGPGVLIDPASDRKRLKEIKAYPGVQEVWLSHWHEDHFLHLDLFDDLPLLISREDAPQLSDLEAFLDGYGIQPQNREMWRSLAVDMFHFRPRIPNQYLEVDASVLRDGIEIRILPAPGHTPGSVALHFPKQSLLFLGDYDLTPFGPWYGDVASSIEQTISSVKMLAQVPASTWLASHEQGIFENPPGPLWDRFLRVIQERENKLLALLEQPCTIEDIVKAWIVYQKPRDPYEFYAFAEKALMAKHLERLIRQGVVSFSKGMYSRNP